MKYFVLLTIVVVISLWILVKSLVFYVPIGCAGVLTKELGGGKGVVAEDFGPGWHLDLGPFHTWNSFDMTVQTLEMTRKQKYGDRRGRDDVRVKSADGYEVSVDVTIKYRIKKGEAHKIRQTAGVGNVYKNSIVRTRAQKVCRDIFGLMKTEDFYNPKARRSRASEIKTDLTQALKNASVEIIEILVKNVQFDNEYEKKIRRKKLADQEVELNKSLEAAAMQRGRREVIEAETKRKVNVIMQEQKAEITKMQAEMDRKIVKLRAEYEKYATEKQADANLIQTEKAAEGELLIKQAEAEGEKLRNQAMQGVGGSTIVALEAARNINLADITISTVDIDLLDIDGMATRLGVKK